jgi:hypothetical protein
MILLNIVNTAPNHSSIGHRANKTPARIHGIVALAVKSWLASKLQTNRLNTQHVSGALAVHHAVSAPQRCEYWFMT